MTTAYGKKNHSSEYPFQKIKVLPKKYTKFSSMLNVVNPICFLAVPLICNWYYKEGFFFPIQLSLKVFLPFNCHVD
uniref:Uncharacterized protein n=1 Tax=Lepeophtheirus salmonis TaxID=72036 RepID=A0A0K2V785_LEPSM